MSHPISTHDIENEYPEDRPLSFSEAIDEMFDPYESIVKENMEPIIRDLMHFI